MVKDTNSHDLNNISKYTYFHRQMTINLHIIIINRLCWNVDTVASLPLDIISIHFLQSQWRVLLWQRYNRCKYNMLICWEMRRLFVHSLETAFVMLPFDELSHCHDLLTSEKVSCHFVDERAERPKMKMNHHKIWLQLQSNVAEMLINNLKSKWMR